VGQVKKTSHAGPVQLDVGTLKYDLVVGEQRPILKTRRRSRSTLRQAKVLHTLQHVRFVTDQVHSFTSNQAGLAKERVAVTGLERSGSLDDQVLAQLGDDRDKRFTRSTGVQVVNVDHDVHVLIRIVQAWL
jgi:hypothetical protein